MADDSRSSSVADARSPWVRTILPSVSDLLFVTVLALLLFTPLAVRLLGDAGTGWHIRTGQQILATHAVPRVDPFSSTMNGKPWFAWEWLYDAIAGGLERWAGLNGVVWFAALVIATVFAWMFRLLMRRGTNLLVALLLVLLAMSASMIHFLARPHVVSWLFTLIWFYFLDSSGKSLEEDISRADRRLWILPLLMIVWVNVHGGFLVGFVLLAIYWVSAVVKWFDLREEKFDDFLLRQAVARRVWRLGIIGAITAVTTLVNPCLWKLHIHIYQYLSDRFLIYHIQEFQSPNFHGAAERCFAVLLLLAMVALAARTRKLRLSEGLVVIFATYSGLYASRNIPVSSLFLVLVAGPRLSEAIEAVWKLWTGMQTGFWTRMRVIESGARGHIWPIAAVVLTAWIVFHGGRLGPKQMVDAHFDGTRFPVSAVDYFEQHGMRGPVLSPDAWGGYLIFRLTHERPEIRVVIDDRHDFYGEATLKSYLKMIRVEPGWKEFLDQHEVGCLLLPKGSALSNIVIESGEWDTVYADDVAIAFVRKSDH